MAFPDGATTNYANSAPQLQNSDTDHSDTCSLRKSPRTLAHKGDRGLPGLNNRQPASHESRGVSTADL